MEEKLSATLSLNEYTELHEYVKVYIENKIAHMGEDEQKTIIAFMSDLVIIPDHLFFTPRTLDFTREAVLSNPLTQEFVLSITTALSVTVSLAEYGHDRLIETILNGICYAHSSGDLSFLPDQIKHNIAIDKEILHSLLTANFWLVALYICHNSNRD